MRTKKSDWQVGDDRLVGQQDVSAPVISRGLIAIASIVRAQ
jgi:hypothetical protein